MQSDESGPDLPDVTPAAPEKSQTGMTGGVSAGPGPARSPEQPKMVAKSATFSKPAQTTKKTLGESKPSAVVAAAGSLPSGMPSHLPIQLTSSQTIESADSKTSTATGPSLNSAPVASDEPKPMPSAVSTPYHKLADAGEHSQPKTGTAAPQKLLAAAAEQSETRPAAPAVRMVNSKRISLNYEVKDVGPSGVSTIELWYTQDGRKWEKCDATPQPNPPFVVDVKEEGLYGFTLVARSGIGLGKHPPRPGDLPQVWVEVDLTKPVVKLLDLQVGVSSDAQHLTIIWKATDKNLGSKPITLYYAELAEGPWNEVAAHVENTGSYVWRLPAGIPHRFHVKVEATDLVGNATSAQTGEPILIDLSQPSAAITAVEPGK